MKIDDAFWVKLVAISIAAACVIAVVVISIREKKMTGRYPSEVLSDRGGWGWFGVFTWLFICSRTWIPDGMIRGFPLCVLYPGLDMALLVAYAAVAVSAMRYAFRSDWHWRVGLWITSQLIFPAIFISVVASDVAKLHSLSGAWLAAAVVTVFAAPFCTRFAYEEMAARGQTEPSTSPEPDFHLWRPGEHQ